MSSPQPPASLQGEAAALAMHDRSGIRASLERLGDLEAEDDMVGLTIVAERQIVRARLIRIAILAFLTAGLLASVFGVGDWVGFLAIVAAGLWIAMGTRSARLLQSARQAALLLAVGRIDDARRLASACATSLSLNRQVPARSLWTLAGVYSTRNDPRRVVHLTSFLLNRPRLSAGEQQDAIRLLLAEALTNLGDPRSAMVAMRPLYARCLSLGPSLRLLLLQFRIEGRTGQYAALAQGLKQKLDMVELMPMPQLLQAHGLLWLAASRTGLTQWEQFLRRRVELLGGAKGLEPVDRDLSQEFARLTGTGGSPP